MTPVSKDTAIELVKVSVPVNRSFTSLTASNDDSDAATDNNDVFSTSCADSGKITPTKLVGKESATNDIAGNIVSNALNESKQSLLIKQRLKTRVVVSLLSFLVLLILSIDQNMSLGIFLAFCVAPVAMLLMTIFELVILDLELI